VANPTVNSLVLYKSYPAKVLGVGDKFEIELSDGEKKRVRSKDISVIHPGPFSDFDSLTPREGECTEAWEMLSGTTTHLQELTELIFGEYSPAGAWAAWKIVQDGLYFSGTPEAIQAREKTVVDAEIQTRERVQNEKAAWDDFVERAKKGTVTAEDRNFILDVEAAAYGKTTRSRLLEALASQVTPENAHATLLRLKFWKESVNPHPKRYDLSLKTPVMTVLPLPEEERVDLTHLPAFAIDDEGNTDPDDALSLENGRLWVHVADVSALIPPDSDIDLEARGRGTSIYLPEVKVAMLPEICTFELGLGLKEISPSLSFGILLGDDGSLQDLKVVRSWVRVTRLTYEFVDTQMNEAPFAEIERLTLLFRTRRLQKSTPQINLPEAKIHVDENDVVTIRHLPSLRSRQLVSESMLMAGAAAAQFAVQKNIPLPFTTQPPPELLPGTLPPDFENDLAAMFSFRKKLKRSQMKSNPEPHAGLGLDAYVRVTSPLRRYLDLVVHQQFRAYLKGTPLLNPQEVLTRVGAAESVLGISKRAERSSNLHWTLVYLKQHRDWRGKGILVDKYGSKGTVLIPELGLEARLFLNTDVALNAEVDLKVASLDIPRLEITMTFA
jgi:exoribonuclease-2